MTPQILAFTTPCAGLRILLLLSDVVRWHNPFCINNKINSVITRPTENLLLSAVVSSSHCKHNCAHPQMDFIWSQTLCLHVYPWHLGFSCQFQNIIGLSFQLFLSLSNLPTISVYFLLWVCAVYQITSDSSISVFDWVLCYIISGLHKAAVGPISRRRRVCVNTAMFIWRFLRSEELTEFCEADEFTLWNE